MKRVWKMTYERGHREEIMLVADTWKDAVESALAYIRQEKPDWKEVSESDIIGLTLTDERVWINNA